MHQLRVVCHELTHLGEISVRLIELDDVQTGLHAAAFRFVNPPQKGLAWRVARLRWHLGTTRPEDRQVARFLGPPPRNAAATSWPTAG